MPESVKYRVKKGTKGKLIERRPNAPPIVKDWTLRKDIEFESSLLDANVIKSFVERAQKAGAQQGYALFGGDSGRDRRAQFVLAVRYNDIEVLTC